MSDDKNQSKVIEMLLKHDEDIKWIKENMATKDDLANMTVTLDKILEVSTGNSQEITMIRRVVERHDEDIRKIKQKLQFA